MAIPGTVGARVTCSNRVFGFWQEGPSSGAPPCARSVGESAKKQYGAERRAVASGALYAFQRRFPDSGLGTFRPAHFMLEGQRALQQVTDNEVIYAQALALYLRGQPTVETRRYEHTARAAFAEKGVFSAWIHVVSAQTLVMSGPFEWSSETEPPQFDVFAPPGSSYEKKLGPGGNVVHLELADNPNFSVAQGVVTDTVRASSPTARVNCAPPGFFRTSPGAAQWQAVAESAAAKSGHVYYRVRQCLAGGSPCIASTTPSVPAYLVLDIPAGGCNNGQCAASPPRGRSPWLWLLGGLVRRKARRHP